MLFRESIGELSGDLCGMLRYEDINDISDGRLYGPDDLVMAGTSGCEGCSKCCESDMGHSIVLDPYDAYNLIKATGESFDQLLTTFKIELSMIDTIVLPNLKMDKGCSFLKDGRCTIHQYRPGICRLFPLGRIYNDKGFDYFLQTKECALTEEKRNPVKVRDWLGIDNLEKNSNYINKWHRFIKFEKKKVAEKREMASHEINRFKKIEKNSLRDYAHILGEDEKYEELGFRKYKESLINKEQTDSEEAVKAIIKTSLSCFYMEGYDVTKDFYEQFDERLKLCLGRLRKN